MIPELGLFFLLLAFLFAVLLSIIPLLGIHWQRPDWIKAARTYVFAQALFVALAYASLTFGFLQDDFSLIYVMNNSSLSLPWFYKLCAVWGGHEGSMLLWVVILNCWMLLASNLSKSLDLTMRTRVLVILGWLNAGFILFLLMTSNPFLRQFTLLNTQGRDLNPLLQDPGFLFHPPMLYMGYVGFSVAFAFAIAALWEGKMEASWSRWTRPWTLAAWCCLTTGITLGSWWAYRELGWGGWWFWDPVENASFMPWLAGTALIHSLAVAEKRQQFKAWTLLLAIMTFSLSLIGTFLVRSGVLTSVHAFAVDPERGIYILVFLALVIGGSLLLFAFRAQTLQNKRDLAFISRESALLLNNVFLVVIMLTVLMGTLYPLFIDALGLGKLSVGAPYFNTVFVPLMMPLLLLMGLGLHLRWGQDKGWSVFRNLAIVAVLSFCLPLIFLGKSLLPLNFSLLAGLMLACWVLLTTMQALIQKIQERGFRRINQAWWGMALAHIGVAVSVIGVAVSTGYGVQDDLQMQPGSRTLLAGYEIVFKAITALEGPNYTGTGTAFAVTRNGHKKMIYPEKRLYNVGQMAMTESAIDVTPFRDIYIALGEDLGDDNWSVRLYYKPLVRWIWAGGFLMLAGGCLALLDRRYYRKKPAIL